MESLKQIASIAGQSGLYRILKPSRNGVIVETIDEKKEKQMIGASARVSVLNDISMYVEEPESSVPLPDILTTIAQKYGDTLAVTAKSPDDELASFMADVLPAYDRERVRISDIKKLVSWYAILRQHLPELFETAAEAAETPTADAEEPATKADAPKTPKPKPASKK